MRNELGRKAIIISAISLSVATLCVSGVAFTYALYENTQLITNNGSQLSISTGGRRDRELTFYVTFDNDADDWHRGSGVRSDINVSFFSSADGSYADALMNVGPSTYGFTITYNIDYFRTTYDMVNVKRLKPWERTLWNRSQDKALYGENETYDSNKSLYLTIHNNSKNELGEYYLDVEWKQEE